MIQDLIPLDKPDGTNFKLVCTDFPNTALITKSGTAVEIQANFGHASVGNTFLGETITTFVLVGYLESPKVVLINAEHASITAGKKICFLVMEVLLCAAVSDLAQ